MRGDALALLRGLLEARGPIKETPRGFLACCPAHDDSSPSLNVDQGERGALIQCRSAKCSSADVAKALGLDVRALFDEEQNKPAKDPSKQREKKERAGWPTLEEAVAWWKSKDAARLGVRVHLYCDGSGRELFAVVRSGTGEGKQFTQFVRKGSRWKAEGLGNKRPLYRLRELLAADAQKPVMLVEGEQKAELLERLGFVATASAQGAQSAKASDWSALRARRVVALPDNDEAGRAYVEEARRLALAAGALSFHVVQLDGLAESEDVVEWAERLDEHTARTKLAQFVENAQAEAREEEEQFSPSWRCLELDEMLALPPVEWLVKDLLPLRGVALLAAEPRVGKSFLALDLAMRVVCGSSSFLDRPVKADGGVVYATLESASGNAGRTRAWRKANPNERVQRRLYYLGWRGEAMLTDGSEEFAADLRKRVRKSGRVSLVIVDTLTLALGADENDSASVGKALRFLSNLADELGCCILVVHHVRKEGKAPSQARARMSLSDVRGSSALVGNVDTVLGLEFQEGRAERGLLVLKSKDGEAGPPLWFKLDLIETGSVHEDGSREKSLVVRSCGAPSFVEPDADELREQREEKRRQRDEQRAEEQRERIVEEASELLRKHPHGLSKTTIVGRIKGRKASKLLILDEALGEGRFVQVRKGNGFVFQLPQLSDETAKALADSGLVPASSRKFPEPPGTRNRTEPRDAGNGVPEGSRSGGYGGTHTHTRTLAPGESCS